MTLVSYHCTDCGFQEDKLYQINENVKSMLEHFCPMCGGVIRKWNARNLRPNQRLKIEVMDIGH
jgi:predicted RNA-binding Zn-ribbon protein involved in translation (DUF1610 family)